MNGVIPIASGFLGSVLMLLGSLGVGFLPHDSPIRDWPPVAAIRATEGLTITAGVLIVAGGLLLLVSWLRLRTVASAAGPGALRTIVTAALVWVIPLLVTLPLFSRDLFSYVAQGRLMTQGIDPYTSGVATLPGWFALGVDPMWADTPSPYGPLYLLVEGAAVRLAGPDSPELAIAILRLLSVASVAVIAVFAIRLARQRGLSVPLTAWVVAANPLTLVLFIVSGHNDSLMLAFILASLSFAQTGRRITAVVLMAGAIAVKPIALIALPVLALLWLRNDAGWRERVRGWLWTGASAIGIVVAIGLLAGVGVGWIPALLVSGSVQHWYAPMSLVAAATSGVVQLTGNDPAAAVAVVKMIALGLAGVAAAVLMLTRRAIDPLVRLAGTFLLFVLASSAIHPWYVLWVLAIAVVARPWRRAHVHLAVYASVFFVCITLAEPVDGGGGPLDQGLARGLTTAAVYAIGFVILLRYSLRESVAPGELVRALPGGPAILRRVRGGRRGASRPADSPGTRGDRSA